MLDRLVTLVSELVLARNQIVQHVVAKDDALLPASAQRLNLITSELQEEIMRTRMQPIGSLWKKLPRQVRDVAAACGKSVRLEMDGAETELDRTVLEAIRDPLTHLVRNAIDHGIENPEIRTACGKRSEGRVHGSQPIRDVARTHKRRPAGVAANFPQTAHSESYDVGRLKVGVGPR